MFDWIKKAGKYVWNHFGDNAFFFLLSLMTGKGDKENTSSAAGAVFHDRLLKGEAGAEGYTILLAKLKKELASKFMAHVNNNPLGRERLMKALDHHWKSLKDGALLARVLEVVKQPQIKNKRGKVTQTAQTSQKFGWPKGYEPERLFLIAWARIIEGGPDMIETAISVLSKRSRTSIAWSSFVEWTTEGTQSLQEIRWSDGLRRLYGWGGKTLAIAGWTLLLSTIGATSLYLLGAALTSLGFLEIAAFSFGISTLTWTISMLLIGLILAFLSWLTGGYFAYRKITLTGISILTLLGAFVLISPDWGPDWIRPFVLLFGIGALPLMIISKSGRQGLPWPGRLVVRGFWLSFTLLFVPVSALEAGGRGVEKTYQAGLGTFEFVINRTTGALPKEEEPWFDRRNQAPLRICYDDPITGVVVEDKNTQPGDRYNTDTGAELRPCEIQDKAQLEQQQQVVRAEALPADELPIQLTPSRPFAKVKLDAGECSATFRAFSDGTGTLGWTDLYQPINVYLNGRGPFPITPETGDEEIRSHLRPREVGHTLKFCAPATSRGVVNLKVYATF